MVVVAKHLTHVAVVKGTVFRTENGLMVYIENGELIVMKLNMMTKQPS